MCGIVSVYAPSGHGLASLVNRMLDTLTHRGPDDSGIWSDDGIALGNCRLAILDLSPTGHQPMVNTTINGVPIEGALTFNGEIFNHQELRQRFEGLIEWRGTSDTETVLALLSVENPVWTCQRLRGMFAFAHWDGQRLTIARDRLGIKPCFYARTPEGTWLVASEVRALRAVAKFDLDWVSLAAYLRLGYIPSPRTAYVGVHELPPGCVGIIENDAITLTPYWQLGDRPLRWEVSGDESGGLHYQQNPEWRTPDLGIRFEDAVRSHLQSDVPVALFAGGGTDSRAIAKTAADLDHPLTGFHVVGDARDYENAGRIVTDGHLGKLIVDPVAPTLWEGPPKEDLDQFIAAMDQPSIDGVNTWYATRLAKRSGFKVVLSGLGGDELFAGYKTFRTVRYIRMLQRVVSERYADLWPGRLPDALKEPRTLKTAYAAARGLFSQAESIALTRGTLQDACRSLDLNDLLPDAADMRRMELSAYLRSQLLRDCDVFSMAHGVEVRPVFLDHPFVEAALAQPLTRREFCRALGLPAPGRKRGFTLPIGEWLTNGVWYPDLAALQGDLAECPAISLNGILQLDRAHWSRRWALLVLAQWLKGVNV